MSEDINVTDGTVLEALNNKVDLDGGNYKGSPLEEYIHKHCGGGQPIGLIYPLVCSPDYIPDGSLPTDGAEYTESQFKELWKNYLTSETPLLNTCTYAEYEQDLLTYGQCGKFAIDLENKTFKVPTVKDGAVIQQALTNDELGKSYNAGLPNIEGTIFASRLRTDTNEVKTGAFANSGSMTKANTANDDSAGTSSLSIDFDASLSNPIYSNSDTVQMNAVAMRYFVVVANGQVNESMMDWSAWASSLQGKANVDFSNITEQAKQIIANIPMPSERYTELAIGANGTTYTAPANGYFTVATVEKKNVTRLALTNTTNGMITSFAPYYDTIAGVFMPVRKNDVVKLEYSEATISYVRFIYAEGEK